MFICRATMPRGSYFFYQGVALIFLSTRGSYFSYQVMALSI